MCYATNDSVNNKRSEFMRVLNWSYRVGCLQCSFNDKELNEYIQLKKRRSILHKKNAVQCIGKQADQSWILGENICISSAGSPITTAESKYIWISNVFSGPGIPSSSLACDISPPFSSEPLYHLLTALHLHLSHNFYSALLVIGSAAFVPGNDSATTLLPDSFSLWCEWNWKNNCPRMCT